MVSSAAEGARSVGSGQRGGDENRAVWIVLVGATLVAGALRFPFLGHQSLWLDEIFSRDIIRAPSLSAVWDQVKATESTPPLYYILGWLLHAQSAAAMRAISTVSLTAAVPVGYLALRRSIGAPAALAAAWVIAVSPVLVSYSTDARSYGLFVLLALASVWAFSALVESVSRARLGLWVLASAACVWTHYFGLFLVAAECAVLLFVHSRRRRLIVLWSLLLAALVSPLIPLVVSQAGDERAEFIAGIPLTRRVVEAGRQFAMGPNVPRSALEAAGIALFYAAVAVGLLMQWRRGAPGRRLPALAALALLAPLLLAVLGIEDRFYSRNLIALVPLAAAIAAPGLLRMRAVPLVLYVALALGTSVWVATDWRYEQSDWRLAIVRVRNLSPRTAVVAVTPSSEPVVQAYLGTAPVPSLLVDRVLLVVEPTRRAGDRALGPAPAPSLPGFSEVQSLTVQGFTVALLRAPRPTPISSGDLPKTYLFGVGG